MDLPKRQDVVSDLEEKRSLVLYVFTRILIHEGIFSSFIFVRQAGHGPKHRVSHINLEMPTPPSTIFPLGFQLGSCSDARNGPLCYFTWEHSFTKQKST